jgi:DNA-binding CsgD family transcriptional regulator
MNSPKVLSEEEFAPRYQKFIQKDSRDASKTNISTRAQVINYFLQGRTKNEIAELLEISPNTVPQYKSQALRTFDVIDFLALQQLFQLYAHITTPIPTPVSATPKTHTQFNNLPHNHSRETIERTPDIEKLLNLISKHPVVCLNGIGGTGKTTTLLQLAHHCRQQTNNFDAIVYISAQTETYTHTGKTTLPADRTLPDIYRQIFSTFDRSELMYTSPTDDQSHHKYLHNCLCQILQQHRTLLIFDNFDTEANYHALQQTIHNIPASTRVLVGSRQKFNINYHTHQLSTLTTTDAEKLIKNHLRKHKLSPAYISQIVEYTGGLPLAIEIIIGLIITRGGAAIELKQFFNGSPKGQELLEYLLDQSITHLQQHQPNLNFGYKILQAIALFPDSASQEALVHITDLNNLKTCFDRGLSELQDLSLIIPLGNDRYKLHQVVHTYMNNLLTNNPPTLKHLQHRWMIWYHHQFVSQFNEQNWQDWQDYEPLKTEWLNISAVIDWCFDEYPAEYQKCIEFWNALKGFTLFRGYWPERQQWLGWLTTAAQLQEDLQTLALALYHRSLTQAYLDEADRSGKALKLAMDAWELNVDFNDRFNLMIRIAMAHLSRQTPEDLNLTKKWLLDATKYQENLPDADLFKIKYYQAELEFSLQNFDAALALCQEAIDLPGASQNQRFVVFAQGRMAKIYIEQGQLEKAETLLINSLGPLTENNDVRATALCQQLLAILKRKQKNENGWKHWRKMAIDSFNRLNMHREANKLLKMTFED